MNNKFVFSKQFFKDVWNLTRAYFTGEDKKRAWGLLIAIIILTLAIVYILVQLNHWYNTFYSALQEYNSVKIYDELIHFTWLAMIYIGLAVYAFYLRQKLILHWREWLTVRFIDEWLSHKTYYNLQMFGTDTDNPDQRISEDVKLFVTMTLGLFIDFLKAVTTLFSFVAILYNLSGTLQFTVFGREWTINGYLFWSAFFYAIFGTWITHVVGRKLVELNYVQQRYEADFRFSMIRMREAAESVAFYGGEERESGVFKNRFGKLLKNFWKLVDKQKQLLLLNSGYGQLAIIFPFVVAMNRYLNKEFTLGGLMQVSSAFGRVQESLSFFVDAYTTIAEWQSVVMRLSLFGRHMGSVADDVEEYHLETVPGAVVQAEGLTVALPNGRVLIKDASFVLNYGTNVLIKGASGVGKSTLLRALSGIWPYTSGKIVVPPKEQSMFIPQKPYLPLGSLREVLTYPGAKTDDNTIKDMMVKSCIGYMADKLDEVADWSHVLSVGEQQRVAFARALLISPCWLFLDEATSALDEDTEKIMYDNIQKYLPNTTVISIGHRSTLAEFHSATLMIVNQGCVLT
ncbi:MAG: ABC transporter ATP-binding protein/permease [Phascolarctobacterium sp.]|nr:ABC transporter ATP-binding protein/permease [Candidatus Phascolarctobacterium caballi]